MPGTNQFAVSLAYKAVAAQLMLAEAGYFAGRLGLPEKTPLTSASAMVSVNHPKISGLGYVETETFVYSFPGYDTTPLTNGGRVEFLERGKLAYVLKKQPFKAYGEELPEIFQKLGRQVSLIDSNGAYRLATQWLSAINVDVAALERDHKPLIARVEHYESAGGETQAPRGLDDPPRTNAALVPLPIFDVSWGGDSESSPPVWVEILGPTKELVLLRMEDTRYSRQSPIVITNALELNARPDPVPQTLRTRVSGNSTNALQVRPGGLSP